jgi:hypothetical protein
MIVRVKWAAMKLTHGYEYAVRFALGGLATVLAGLIADGFGPEVGGLVLAFPAIFCGSATLVEKHERDQKVRQGLKGEEGRRVAALDATGAAWGSVARGLRSYSLADRVLWSGSVAWPGVDAVAFDRGNIIFLSPKTSPRLSRSNRRTRRGF